MTRVSAARPASCKVNPLTYTLSVRATTKFHHFKVDFHGVNALAIKSAIAFYSGEPRIMSGVGARMHARNGCRIKSGMTTLTYLAVGLIIAPLPLPLLLWRHGFAHDIDEFPRGRLPAFQIGLEFGLKLVLRDSKKVLS